MGRAYACETGTAVEIGGSIGGRMGVNGVSGVPGVLAIVRPPHLPHQSLPGEALEPSSGDGRLPFRRG